MKSVFGGDSVELGRPGIDLPDGPVYSEVCTILGRDGQPCGAQAFDDTRVSICEVHAAQVYHELTDATLREHQERGRRVSMRTPQERRAAFIDREARRQAASVVYYAGNRGSIKIGRTINLIQRMQSLRIDPKWIMAIEPGSFEVETRRLHQFAHLRYGRTEDFDPGDDLIAHIKALRQQYGPPRITTDPFGLLADLEAQAAGF